MKSFRIKTHRLESSYQQPHFFILNKGLNSGKPLNQTCPNCFVCLTNNDEDWEFLYWLCFGLWRSKSFHILLKGSVIPFVTIDEIQKLIRESSTKASCKAQAFEKAIQTLQLLDTNEQKIKLTLKMIHTARQAIFYELMKNSGAGWCHALPKEQGNKSKIKHTTATATKRELPPNSWSNLVGEGQIHGKSVSSPSLCLTP